MAYSGYGNNSEQSPDMPANAKTKEPDDAADKGGEPAAGPHGKPHLTNEDATPGAGTLPEVGDADATDSTSG